MAVLFNGHSCLGISTNVPNDMSIFYQIGEAIMHLLCRPKEKRKTPSPVVQTKLTFFSIGTSVLSLLLQLTVPIHSYLLFFPTLADPNADVSASLHLVGGRFPKALWIPPCQFALYLFPSSRATCSAYRNLRLFLSQIGL